MDNKPIAELSTYVITNNMQNPLFNDILTNYFTGPAHLKKNTN